MLVIFTLSLQKVKQTSLEFLLFVCLVSGEKILVVSECGRSVNPKVQVEVILKKQKVKNTAIEIQNSDEHSKSSTS